MELLEAIKHRYSSRKFASKKVELEKMEQLIEAGRLAPSACNLQLTEYILLDNEEKIKKLASKASKKFLWAPNFIIVLNDSRFSKHRMAGVQSAGMAIQNILLRATDLGLGSCPMAGFSNDKFIKEELKIPDFYDILLIIAIGYSQEESRKAQRVESEKIAHKNEYRGSNFLNESIKLSDWSIKQIKNYRQRIAPVYLYKKHFHLGIFPEKIYEKMANIVLQEAGDFYKNRLDLFSYDMFFLKYFKKDAECNYYSANYIDYINRFAEEEFGANAVEIKKNNQISAKDSSFDFITCACKLEFTPELYKLFKELKRILAPKGRIAVISFKEDFLKGILRCLQNLFLKRNVYENNPFYKIGPYSFSNINKIAEKSGLKLEKKKKIFSYNHYNFYINLYN